MLAASAAAFLLPAWGFRWSWLKAAVCQLLYRLLVCSFKLLGSHFPAIKGSERSQRRVRGYQCKAASMTLMSCSSSLNYRVLGWKVADKWKDKGKNAQWKTFQKSEVIQRSFKLTVHLQPHVQHLVSFLHWMQTEGWQEEREHCWPSAVLVHSSYVQIPGRINKSNSPVRSLRECNY